MLAHLTRVAARALSVPLTAAWGARRSLLGSHLVVEVRVLTQDGVQARQAWLHRVRRLAADPTVEAVLFRIEESMGGWASHQDLRAAIGVLREAGKGTYAFVESPGNAGVWVASACERVFAVPTGELNLVGVGVELTFFGSALERLGVRPDLEAAGAYKSFGEPFTRSFASPSNLEAVDALVTDLHRQLVADVARSRHLTEAQVQALLDRAPLGAEEAVGAGLVDELLYADQLERWIEERHGERSKLVPFGKWATADTVSELIDGMGASKGSVAVLHLEGPIVMDGQGARPQIRARAVVPILKGLREDDGVAAVVLHVNSGGGSALASDLIWREVEQLRKTKPVIASFEDVAASGGYYLAAPAAEIFARPATLTGSIGVFGGKMVLGEALRKVGVSSQQVTAGENAVMFSASKRFTDPQRARFRSMLERTYDGFVKRVADGRRLREDAIEPHCRGRVWTGQLAMERRLVDRLGTLDEAVSRAKVLAGIPSTSPRRDLTGQPVSVVAKLVRQAMGGLVPQLTAANGLLGLAQQLFAASTTPAFTDALDVLLTHEGQALAMLPFDARPR